MIDIKLIRENPEAVKASLKKRDIDTAIVDEIKKQDEEWRSSLKKVEDLKHERNTVNQKIAAAKGEGKDAKSKIEEMKRIG